MLNGVTRDISTHRKPLIRATAFKAHSLESTGWHCARKPLGAWGSLMVVSWHRASAEEGSVSWVGTSAPHPNKTSRGGRSYGMQLHGLEFGQPTGWNGTAVACIPLFAGWRSLHIIYNIHEKIPQAAVIGPQEPAIKETVFCLLMKFKPQQTRWLSILTLHLRMKLLRQSDKSEK